ncbi:hypothetical protein EV715DRAFT_173108, partial [Schizophyllum commune]
QSTTSAPSSTTRLDRLSRVRAAREEDSGELVVSNCQQPQIREGDTCRSSAGACGLTSIALSNRFGEKLGSSCASSGGFAEVDPRAQMSSYSSLDVPKCSLPSTECDGNEEPVRCADSGHVFRPIADHSAFSSSATPRINATREPPDKRSSWRSNTDSYMPSSRWLPDDVLSYAPLLLSSRGSEYGNGHDRTNWRAQGRPAEPMQREIDAQDASERTAASPRKGINLCGARNGREHSSQSTEARRDRGESPTPFPDLDGQRRVLQASADSLSPSPSSAPRRQAARKRPDKMTLDSSSLRSGEPTSHLRSTTVPSAAPSHWSPRQSRSGSGPDSANWRVHGWPTALSPREVNTLDADSRSKRISEHERALKVFDRQEEAFSQASAQGGRHVYAGGQVLASSRRDGKPESSRHAGRFSPQSAGVETIATIPDDSGCTPAMVETRAQISSHSWRENEKRSPRRAKRDRDQNPAQFLDLDGRCRARRASANSLSPSPSSVPRYHAAREPPDKTALDRLSLHSCPSTSDSHVASVLSAAPVLPSSHQPAYGSGPDSANRRAREWPAVLMQRKIDPRDAGERTAASSCKGFDFSVALNGREHSSRSDVACITSERAYHLCSHSTKRRRASELRDDGAGNLKCVHAGGQTAVLSYKDIKLQEARTMVEEKPQLTSPHSHGKDNSIPRCGNSALRPGRQGAFCSPDNNSRDTGILHAEKLPRVTLSSSADVPDTLALGCAACPGTMLCLYDDPGVPADVASSGDGHPSDAYSVSSPSRLLVCHPLRQSVVRAEKSRRPCTVDGHVSFEVPVTFSLVNSRSAERDMSARLAFRSQIGGDTCKGPMGNISAFPTKD